MNTPRCYIFAWGLFLFGLICCLLPLNLLQSMAVILPVFAGGAAMASSAMAWHLPPRPEIGDVDFRSPGFWGNCSGLWGAAAAAMAFAIWYKTA